MARQVASSVSGAWAGGSAMVIGSSVCLRPAAPACALAPCPAKQPDELIPIVERTGEIREVGHWVLQHACEQMAAWHTSAGTLDISVNARVAPSRPVGLGCPPRAGSSVG